ncbi:DUF4238 domain-containing protein [Tabrizicola sp.]|jgi:hypothetical protein|uniref:DUF4238 domain-containing protein n=1 Tax=Tabrizicola sp. TaxID=2005166 RepID=UPI0025E66305|nr:DUF4238 domain-containing protein [Tabrizicola sp.]MBY0350268.1 DUF4238 domain-containing protein [Tabrizicola sp.]MDK2773513.1 DUF4238 domain-containing protein [Tabrizicola sp.]
MAPASKNHHYIPRSILRQFCFEGESLLLFDAMFPERGYRQRSIDRAFQKFHGNSIEYENGERSDHVEKWLSDNIDSPLGAILSEGNGNLELLLETQSKRILARYLVTLLFRAPRGREALVEVPDSISDAMSLVFKLAKMFGVEEQIDVFGQGVPSDLRSALEVSLPTLISDQQVEQFMDFELVLATPQGHEVFCIFDFPMMRYDDPRNALFDDMHEYWFVLSPKIAACFMAKTSLPVDGCIFQIPDTHVRRMNFDFAMRSQFVAANCPVVLHQTVRHLGRFPTGRSLDETNAAMFERGGKYFPVSCSKCSP